MPFKSLAFPCPQKKKTQPKLIENNKEKKIVSRYKFIPCWNIIKAALFCTSLLTTHQLHFFKLNFSQGTDFSPTVKILPRLKKLEKRKRKESWFLHQFSLNISVLSFKFWKQKYRKTPYVLDFDRREKGRKGFGKQSCPKGFPRHKVALPLQSKSRKLPVPSGIKLWKFSTVVPQDQASMAWANKRFSTSGLIIFALIRSFDFRTCFSGQKKKIGD